MKTMDKLKNSPIKTGASFMVTDDSINEIEDVIKIAVDKNLNVISFYLVAELGRGANNFKNQKDILIYKLQNKIKKLEKWKKETTNNLKIEVFRADSWEENDEVILQECKAEQFLNITYDGFLGGCPWLMKSDDEFNCGSLLEEDFLILKKKCQDKIKQKKEERKEKLSFCNKCSRKQECGKGCPALQIKDNKLYYALDPICPSLHLNIITKNNDKQILKV